MEFKTLMAVMLLLVSTNVFANGLVCRIDRRHVDGPLMELQLNQVSQNPNRYEFVYFSPAGQGMAGRYSETRVVLARELDCTFAQTDARIVLCSGSGRTSVSTKYVLEKNLVQKTEPNGQTEVTENISETIRSLVSSPELNAIPRLSLIRHALEVPVEAQNCVKQ